jgi:Ca2+/H+ antiporter
MFEIFLHCTEKITQFLIAYGQIIGVVLLNLLLMFGLCWVCMKHTLSKKIHCTAGLNFVDYRDI